MSTTLKKAREQVARKTGFFRSGTVTTAITTDTNVIDSALADEFYNDGDLTEKWVHITSENNAGEERVVKDYTATGTIDAYGANFADDGANKADYEITNFKPSDIMDALNDAVNDEYKRIYQEIEDTTLFTTKNQTAYSRPTDVSHIFKIYLENPLNPKFDENILYEENASVDFDDWSSSSYPDGANSVSNLTCTKYGTTDQERNFIPPQYGEYLMKMVSSGSAGYIDWSISNPSYYAGQKVVLEVPVYCETASEFTLSINDGVGSSSSPAHKGTGRELLRVTHTMDDSPSEFTVKIVSAGNTVVGFAAKIILCRAEHYPSSAWTLVNGWEEYNDLIRFDHTLPVGKFLRIVGKKALSTFSADTDTTELDEPEAQVFYWAAVRNLWRMKADEHFNSANNVYEDRAKRAEGELARVKRLYARPIPNPAIPWTT